MDSQCWLSYAGTGRPVIGKGRSGDRLSQVETAILSKEVQGLRKACFRYLS